MKKILFLALFLWAYTISVFGQTYNVNWGSSYKKDGGLFGMYYLIGMEDDHYYILMNPKKRNTLLKYNMNHKLVSNKELNMKYKKDNINVNRFIKTKNATFGYLTKYDRKQKKLKIFASEFKTGTFGQVKELYAHDYDITLLNVGSYGSDNTTLIESVDKNYVVYTNVNSNFDNLEQEAVSVVVFDADMNIVWEKTQRFKYRDHRITISQTVVGNDGTVYILAKVWEKKKNRAKKEKGLPKFDFKAFKITDDGMEEYLIDLGTGIAPTDMGIYFPKNNQEFILAGFYTDANKRSGIKGVFYASGDSSTGIENTSTHEFDASFLAGLTKDKNIEKERGLNTTFPIKDFLMFQDGSISFIAEENYMNTRTYTNSRGVMKTSYTFHTNDIILPRFSNTGELINIQKIEKSFTSSNSLNTSYNIALCNSKTYLIFNDFKDKSELKKMGGKKKKQKWKYADLVVIGENGDIEYNNTLFNSDEIDLEFIPAMSDYNSNTILLGSMSMKKYAFGTLQLD